MATYTSGATNLIRSHNFVSNQELHKPHIQSKLVKRYNETLTGFMDLAGAKAATDSMKYTRFEKKRIMPKIKASNGGAGQPGESVSFTIHADAKTSFASFSPYDTGTGTTNLGAPVKKYDIIQIRPAAGTLASAGNYINCIVTSVTSNTAFAATPLVSTQTIPNIASAQEIIIISNAHGEGTGFQAAMSTEVEDFSETLQIIKHKYEVTGSEKLQALWVEEEGGRFMLPGEADGYLQFLNVQDTTFLVGQAISNTTFLATKFMDGNFETNAPILTTNGVITQALDGGNTLNYSSITGLTLADLYDYNTVIDKQSAEKENMVSLGIDLDQQLDKELGDKVVNGAISYGSFSFDQEKAIALNFSRVRLGSFTYNKRCLNAMNDVQTLGADGYGYSYEALMLPLGMSKVAGGSEAGTSVPSLRKRFLANKGKSREVEINMFDGLTMSDAGTDTCEVRYQAHVGVELQAKNKAGYWKRA